MMDLITRLVKDDEGQGLVEYALIIAVVAVLIVGSLVIFREKLEDIFENIGDALSGSPANP